MKTLLQINSGMQGQESHSSMLANRMTNSLLAQMPGAKHIKRDLSEEEIPHLNLGVFQSFSDPDSAVTPTQKAALALSNTLVAELKQSSILIIGAPMYNFMIPSVLKSWIDHVIRAQETFRYGENGPVGLLENKKTYIVIAQGGKFLGTEADIETEYLKMALGLIGITDIEFIYAQGLAMGPQGAEVGLKEA
ncbi:FMN-dependent NADH-azoreductase [BD1-7 clade bacterium]|uniref:FMN dependent NADH:quinone oxidoreductase n=1 Tax=BD1-7 clade bacterium TaxID=2029982 RepID=A0A5S9P670_9GAMM|nr:FMN-dependent NADH-azoreductase [BD1-7 clade bacterium]